MDMGILIIFILFLFIDLILIYRPVPILAFPVMVFFLWVGITQFFSLSSASIPMNPYTSIFFIFFCGIGILVNGLDVMK